MIQKHQQLFRHDPYNGIYGDCWRTVIACLLREEPTKVPHVCDGPEDGQAEARMQAWLADRGLALIGVNFTGDCDLEHILQVGASRSAGLHWMLTGTSRNGVNHVVICKGDQIIHDTSIDQSGIVGPAKSGYWLIEWLVARLPCDSAPPASHVVGYQERVAAAHVALFHDDPTDIAERVARYAEETNEVLQAFGMSREDMHRLVDYTCDRPTGEPAKEIGAALLTLTSLCVVAGLDLIACGEADLEKLQRPETIARIRAKRATRHGRGPLPGLDPSTKVEVIGFDLGTEGE